jgi:hypothetical protein
MNPPPDTPPLSYEQLERFLSELNTSIQRVKVQTGELAATREQISTIDRALRGHNGEPGLIGRFIYLEKSLTRLVDEQVPDMLATIGASVKAVDDAKSNLQACQLHHELNTQQVRNELARLRDEYLKHLEEEKKAKETETKEEAKFGGREWFREHASDILVGVVKTAITVLITAAVTALVVSRVFP